MIIINESTYLAKIIKKKVKIEENIEIFSTKGFLYDYIVDNKGVTYIDKDNDVSEYLKSIKNSEIIVATDLDGAGHLIALEVISKLDKSNSISRLMIPFESLLEEAIITKDYLIRNSSKKIDSQKAINYLETRGDTNKDARLLAIKYIIENNITSVSITNKRVWK